MRLKVFDVFTERLFSGNPTGIVYWEGEPDRRLMQDVARELNLPDTMFLRNVSPSGPVLFDSLAFSPYEEMTLCGQGMIGAFSAVHEDHDLPEGIYTIGTAVGQRRISWRGGLASVSMGKPYLYGSPPEAASVPGLKERPLRQSVVDLSRRRLLTEVPADALPTLDLPPVEVRAACAQLSVNGLVFFARTGDAEVRSRHFTTSLNGGEDAVTGGASAAILALLHEGGEAIDMLDVYQGDFATRGGRMRATRDADSGEVYVGGHTRKFSNGTILLNE